MPWIQKYAPKRIEEVPQKEAVKHVEAYIKGYRSQKKRALLIHGPAGSGKTSAVHAIAASLGLELVETNASESRNADAILEKIGSASLQGSLFGGSKIILVDEVDGIAGREDRGGVATLIDVIEKSKFPMILTANDAWEDKLSSLRKKVVMIEFPPLDVAETAQVLQRICTGEGLVAEDLALKGIARRSGGDLRAAINDLESLASVNKNITRARLIELEDRNKEESLFDALVKILKTSDPSLALAAFDNVNENLDGVLPWIEENIPHEYKKPSDILRAFDALSRADVFLGRIRRWQHWRFLTYVNSNATAGVSLAKEAKYSGFVQYAKPSRILSGWILQSKYKRRDAIAEKIKAQVHCSLQIAIRQYIPLFIKLSKNPEMCQNLGEEYGFDADDVAWLRQSATI